MIQQGQAARECFRKHNIILTNALSHRGNHLWETFGMNYKGNDVVV